MAGTAAAISVPVGGMGRRYSWAVYSDVEKSGNKTLNVTAENGGLSIAHNALKSIADKAAEIGRADKIILNVERKRNEDLVELRI